MRYIEALEEYHPQPDDISVFAGGGISGCTDWQKEFGQLLDDTQLIFLNPRRENFPMNDPTAAEEQIRWEFRHLPKATIAAFWFAPETLCPITLFELGTFMNTNHPLVVGIHPDYKRKIDVEVQVGLYRPGTPIVYSVKDMAQAVIDLSVELVDV